MHKRAIALHKDCFNCKCYSYADIVKAMDSILLYVCFIDKLCLPFVLLSGCCFCAFNCMFFFDNKTEQMLFL